MAGKKRKIRPSLADKLIKMLSRARNNEVIDLNAWKHSQHVLEEQRRRNPSPDRYSELDPSSGVYAFAHNKMVDLIEILQELTPLRRLINTIADAEDVYLPQGPPMSPITKSCFSAWSFFDLCLGGQEPLACTIKEVGLWMGLHSSYGPLLDHFSQSRLGLYLHEGCVNEQVCLTEIPSGKRFTCVVASGDTGQKGSLWLTRILPPPFSTSACGVVYGTPYQLVNTAISSWARYLERNYPKTRKKDSETAHEHLMKYGLKPCYWLEYLMAAYVNHTPHLIFITGVPDQPESLPHGDLEAMMKNGLIR